MPRLAILDLDGTLVDSGDDLAASVNHALRAVALPERSVAEIRTFVGDGVRRLVERSVAPHAELLEPALAAWWPHYEAHCLDTTRLYPGVRALLEGAGRVLAVDTNKPGRLARKILAGLGVLERFAVVVGGDEVPRKPDPAGASGIRAQVGASAEETVFVGDTPIDVATARAAGVRGVAVTWGFASREALVRAGATSIVDDAAALAPWLD